MYILAGIAALLVLFIVGVVIAASLRSKEVHYRRTIITSAGADTVFAIFSDLGRWREWSPYDERDPEMKTTLSTPSTGIDAKYTWDGNKEVGAGRMTITAVDPGRSLDMRLEFDRPFKCDNHVEWRVDEENDQRRITWSMDGKDAPLMPRIVGLFIDMDKMVGKDWEAGLETLKGIAEREEAAR